MPEREKVVLYIRIRDGVVDWTAIPRDKWPMRESEIDAMEEWDWTTIRPGKQISMPVAVGGQEVEWWEISHRATAHTRTER